MYIKMSKKTPTKDDLFWFLDIFTFDGIFDVNGAIEQFFRESVEMDENYQASYWERSYYQELADEYIKDRNLTFEEDKPQLQRDTEWIIEAYENKVEQYADYYSESY